MSKLYTVLVNGERFEVELKKRSRRAVAFRIADRSYVVSLESVSAGETKQSPLRQQRIATSSSASSQLNSQSLHSPIPGIVLAVLVSPGQAVNKGDVLVRIEAMKMENNIFAHRSGKIGKICVSEQTEVAHGQELLEIIDA